MLSETSGTLMNEQLPSVLFLTIVHYPDSGRRFIFPVPRVIKARRIATEETYGHALEHIFREMNHVDGTEWIGSEEFERRYTGARSMSVGDVVEFKTAVGSRRFRVESEGWSEVA
jgi:hypothetical protein